MTAEEGDDAPMDDPQSEDDLPYFGARSPSVEVVEPDVPMSPKSHVDDRL